MTENFAASAASDRVRGRAGRAPREIVTGPARLSHAALWLYLHAEGKGEGWVLNQRYVCGSLRRFSHGLFERGLRELRARHLLTRRQPRLGERAVDTWHRPVCVPGRFISILLDDLEALPLQAVAALAVLQALGGRAYARELRAELGVGRDAQRAAVRPLVEAGYAVVGRDGAYALGGAYARRKPGRLPPPAIAADRIPADAPAADGNLARGIESLTPTESDSQQNRSPAAGARPCAVDALGKLLVTGVFRDDLLTLPGVTLDALDALLAEAGREVREGAVGSELCRQVRAGVARAARYREADAAGRGSRGSRYLVGGDGRQRFAADTRIPGVAAIQIFGSHGNQVLDAVPGASPELVEMVFAERAEAMTKGGGKVAIAALVREVILATFRRWAFETYGRPEEVAGVRGDSVATLGGIKLRIGFFALSQSFVDRVIGGSHALRGHPRAGDILSELVMEEARRFDLRVEDGRLVGGALAYGTPGRQAEGEARIIAALAEFERTAASVAVD